MRFIRSKVLKIKKIAFKKISEFGKFTYKNNEFI